jgi:hypothetical protein
MGDDDGTPVSPLKRREARGVACEPLSCDGWSSMAERGLLGIC